MIQHLNKNKIEFIDLNIRKERESRFVKLKKFLNNMLSRILKKIQQEVVDIIATKIKSYIKIIVNYIINRFRRSAFPSIYKFKKVIFWWHSKLYARFIIRNIITFSFFFCDIFYYAYKNQETLRRIGISVDGLDFDSMFNFFNFDGGTIFLDCGVTVIVIALPAVIDILGLIMNVAFGGAEALVALFIAVAQINSYNKRQAALRKEVKDREDEILSHTADDIRHIYSLYPNDEVRRHSWYSFFLHQRLPMPTALVELAETDPDCFVKHYPDYARLYAAFAKGGAINNSNIEKCVSRNFLKYAPKIVPESRSYRCLEYIRGVFYPFLIWFFYTLIPLITNICSFFISGFLNFFHFPISFMKGAWHVFVSRPLLYLANNMRAMRQFLLNPKPTLDWSDFKKQRSGEFEYTTWHDLFFAYKKRQQFEYNVEKTKYWRVMLKSQKVSHNLTLNYGNHWRYVTLKKRAFVLNRYTKYYNKVMSGPYTKTTWGIRGINPPRKWEPNNVPQAIMASFGYKYPKVPAYWLVGCPDFPEKEKRRLRGLWLNQVLEIHGAWIPPVWHKYKFQSNLFITMSFKQFALDRAIASDKNLGVDPDSPFSYTSQVKKMWKYNNKFPILVSTTIIPDKDYVNFNSSINTADTGIFGKKLFQDSATDSMSAIIDFHGDLMFILIIVCAFVCWLLFCTYLLFAENTELIRIDIPNTRSSELKFFTITSNYKTISKPFLLNHTYKVNHSNFFFKHSTFYLFDAPYRSKKSTYVHHTFLEIIWTFYPAFILFWIALPSFALLYSSEELLKPKVTLQVIGNQWYWSYDYTEAYLGDDPMIVLSRKPNTPKEDISWWTWLGFDQSKTEEEEDENIPIWYIEDFKPGDDVRKVLVGPNKWQWYVNGVKVRLLDVPDDTKTKDEYTQSDLDSLMVFYLLYNTYRYPKPGLTGMPMLDLIQKITLEAHFRSLHSPQFPITQMMHKQLLAIFLEIREDREKQYYNDFIDACIAAIEDSANRDNCTYSEMWDILHNIYEEHVKKSPTNPYNSEMAKVLESILDDYEKHYKTHREPKKENVTFSFDSYMLLEDDLKFGTLRLLETDKRVILPVNCVVRLLVTSSDVLHSWAVPSFGIKIDACPGRLNQVEFCLRRSGVFYGQCSEICGINHAYMPITVVVVPGYIFNCWYREMVAGAHLSAIMRPWAGHSY